MFETRGLKCTTFIHNMIIVMYRREASIHVTLCSIQVMYRSYVQKRSKRQRKKGKIYPFECRVSRIARRDKKASLSEQCKEIEETIEWEKPEISSRKLEKPREHFMQRWAQ